jgi:DNA end-binding protein Ku
MAPRASWKGFINLSLVSVPVKAYSANDSSGNIRLNQLHQECNSRINYKVTCPKCGDIPRSDLVKGYEYSKDQYVVIDLDELELLRAKDENKAIRIDKFIHPEQVDPRYMSETTYYLVPDGAPGQKPFTLLREALDKKYLACIAHVVLHNKEQLVLVRTVENLLAMTVLRYESELKDIEQFNDEVVTTEISEDEYKLAEKLIDETTVDEFSIGDYEDKYHERLTALIEAKVAGKEIVASPDVKVAPVVNLMEALKASVQQIKGTDPEKTPPKRRRRAPVKEQVAKRGKTTKAKRKSSSGSKKTTRALADQLAAPKKKTTPKPKKKVAKTRKKKTG